MARSDRFLTPVSRGDVDAPMVQYYAVSTRVSTAVGAGVAILGCDYLGKGRDQSSRHPGLYRWWFHDVRCGSLVFLGLDGFHGGRGLTLLKGGFVGPDQVQNPVPFLVVFLVIRDRCRQRHTWLKPGVGIRIQITRQEIHMG